MIYNGFDFTHPDFKKTSIDRQRFLKSNYDKPVTEDEFVLAVIGWPKKDLHNSKSRSPSAARNQYRRLVRKYGFFQEKPQAPPRSISNAEATGRVESATT